MKRSGPPPRRTPLTAKTGLPRGVTPLPEGKPLQRSTPMSRGDQDVRRGPGPRAEPRPAPRRTRPQGEAAAERHARAVVADRSSGVCEVQRLGCCLFRASNCHHRKNRSQGGEWSASNLLHVCGSGVSGCHGWITGHPAAASEDGWTVRRGEDPAAVPVAYRDGQRYLLNDLGDRIAVNHHHEGTDDG